MLRMKLKYSVQLLILICLASLMCKICFGKIMNTSETQLVMENLFKNSSSTSKTIPAFPGKPVKVFFSLWIHDMAPLDVYHDHIFLDCFIQQEWVDERLKFNSSVPNATIVLTGKNVENIWLPNLWINGERAHDDLNFVSKNAFLQINNAGGVAFLSRISINVFCAMNYTYFPFDHQLCELIFESYGDNLERMNLLPSVRSKPLILDKNLGNRKFLLADHTISVGKNDYGTSGVFDQLIVQLHLRREINYYIMDYYFPLALVVSASWISFWLDYRCIPARTALPVTTFLTLISMAENIRSRDFGSRSFSTVMEIYINVCVMYAFAALVEYAVVGVTCTAGRKRASKKTAVLEKVMTESQPTEDVDICRAIEASQTEAREAERQTKRQENDISSIDLIENENGKMQSYKAEIDGAAPKVDKIQSRQSEYHIIDSYCRILFPTTFVVFNITYAIVCIFASS